MADIAASPLDIFEGSRAELDHWLEENSATSAPAFQSKKPQHKFIIHPKLQSHFPLCTVRRLLKEAKLRPTHGRHTPNVDSEQVHQHFPKIFLILLAIDKGEHIVHFVNSELNDSTLPFVTRDSLPDRSASIFGAFDKEQWMFIAPVLKRGKNRTFRPKLILPIVKQSKIGEGGYAKIYKVRIHENFNELIPRGTHQRHANEYAIKIYAGEKNRKYAGAELTAYSQTEGCDGIIRCFASYEQGDATNIILEYTDGGTLQDFFDQREPPCNAQDVIDFYKSLLFVVMGISRLHNANPTPLAKNYKRGIHQDIKPENILYVHLGSKKSSTRFYGTFKLADFGLSQVFAVGGDIDELVLDHYGGQTWGTPECYRADSSADHLLLEITEKMDIWSLGCVLLEAMVFVTFGKRGLQKFREAREKELERFADFRIADCFHDGYRPLKSVRRMENTIEERLKESRDYDYVTKGLLPIVESMIQQKEARVGEANTIYTRLHNVLADVEQEKGCKASHQIHRGSLLMDDPTDTDDIVHPDLEAGSSTDYRSAQKDERRADLSILDDRSHLPTAISHRHSWSGPKTSSSGVLLAGGEGRKSLMLPPTSTPPIHRRRHETEVSESTRTSHRMHDQNESRYAPLDEIQRPASVDTITSRTISIQSPGDLLEDQTSVHGAPARPYLTPPLAPQQIFPTSTSPNQQSPPQQSSREYQWRRGTYGLPLLLPLPDRPPSMSLWEAIAGKEENKKKNKQNFFRKPEPVTFNHPHLISQIMWRNHIFLVDDSDAMRDHWAEVMSAIDVLAWIVKRGDDSGVEMRFTNSPDSKTATTAASLLNLSDKKWESRRWDRHDRGPCRMETMVGRIFSEYRHELLCEPGAKPLSLYVFTSGIWERHGVAKHIKQIADYLKQWPATQVGIQFIRFGDDPMGKETLDSLDAGLGGVSPGLRNIVDHEPINGNVWKMLLGSIDPVFHAMNSNPG